MSLSKPQTLQIEGKLKGSIRYKFENYNPKQTAMPFHTRLLGKDRLVLYKFIHSLFTNFGTSIFEPVAELIAEGNFDQVKTGVVVGDKIYQSAQTEIQEILDDLITGRSEPDKKEEINRIRSATNDGYDVSVIKPTKADLMLVKDNEVYLIDIKTAKPNYGNVKEFKRTLLEWVGVKLCENPNADVNTLIAIPYNPYAPIPYGHWTFSDLFDLEHDIKMEADFWNFLGRDNTYKELLDCFERVGIELRNEIENFFAQFQES